MEDFKTWNYLRPSIEFFPLFFIHFGQICIEHFASESPPTQASLSVFYRVCVATTVVVMGMSVEYMQMQAKGKCAHCIRKKRTDA